MKIKILMAAMLLTWSVASNAQQGSSRGGDPIQRAEMQSKMMVDSLSLSTKQAEKVREINLRYAQKQQEARSSAVEGEWDKQRAAMEAIRTEQNTELKTVLSTEQYDRWQKVAEAQWKTRGKGGYQPPAQNSGDDTAPKEKEEKGRKGKKDAMPPTPPPVPNPAPTLEKTGGNR